MDRWRSLLFVPGIQERMLVRAPGAGSDGLILDLEASVPAGAKEQARSLVVQAIPRIAAATPAPIFVRLNTLASGLPPVEISALVQPELAGFVLPATNLVAEVQEVDRLIAAAEVGAGMALGRVRLLLILESARGVLHAFDLLSASPRVAAALFGAEDFRQDMGVPRTAEGAEVAFARASVALAARAAGVAALDMVYTDVQNEAGLEAEARAGRTLGYSGKQVIHPRQIAPVHRAMGPTEAEVAWARRVLAEAARAAAGGAGAFLLDGQMIDRPVIAQAEQILRQAADA